MDAITGYISAHPALLVLGVIFIILLLLNLVFKSIMKLVLVILFILLAAFGYYSFKEPGTMQDKINKSVELMKSGFSDLADKSKSFYTDSKDLYKKTKDAPGQVNKLLDTSDKELKKDFKK